jgi:hypothetical protein
MSAGAMANTTAHLPGASWTIFLLWCLIVGVAAYWYAVLTGQGVVATPSYLDFSKAFPPADSLMAASAVVCAVQLQRRRATAVLWGHVTAGALGFVGVVDVTYNLQHDIYAEWTPALAWEAWVNLFSLAFPVWLVRFCWTNRHALGA